VHQSVALIVWDKFHFRFKGCLLSALVKGVASMSLWSNFHGLLQRQLKRYIGNDPLLPDGWQAFLNAVNEAYVEFDADRCLLERALNISSQELFQSNEELNGILQALPDLLFRIDANGKIIDLTQKESALFHLPIQAVDNNPPAGPPDSPARQFWHAIQQVRDTKTSVNFEYQECSHNHILYYEVRLVLFSHHDIIGIIRNITVRKHAENALRLSEETAKRAQADLLKVKFELEEERVKLQHLATHDSLTGIWNRRAIFDLLSSELSRAKRAGHSVTVIMLDVDRFKAINDHYGHPVGDIVLQEVTRRLNSCIRTSDEIGRYGGEEFLIVLPDCDGYSAFSRAEQFRKIIEGEPIPLAHGDVLHVTCSFGVHWTQFGCYDGTELVQEADSALYLAKKSGRNRVETAYTLIA
jgi:diguanylate cyclase (GGDEF)-like protein